MKLHKIISGGQTGVDIAALVVATQYGIDTGGWMPKGYRTLDGNKPEYNKLYGVQEHPSSGYKLRTHTNVQVSDGTLRIAGNFDSLGEVCTLNAIKKYEKPYFDVLIVGNKQTMATMTYFPLVSDWIIKHDIKILNVAGNSEKTFPGIYKFATFYIADIFKHLGFIPPVAAQN